MNNSQAEQISKKMIDTPSDTERAESNKQILISDKNKQYEIDQANRDIFLRYLSIITQYHFELRNIDGTIRSLYDEANLNSSAKREDGNVHFPLGYKYFVPQLVPSNNGNPKTSEIRNEISFLNSFIRRVSLFKNGLSNNANATSTTSVLSYNSVDVSSVGTLTNGDIVVIYNGSDLFQGTIGGVNGNTLSFNVSIESNAPMASGGSVVGVFPSYSNAQRETLLGTTEFNSIRFSLDSNSSKLLEKLSNQLEAIKANVSGDDFKNPLSSLNEAISAVKSWQSSPSSGSGIGRYGDTVIDQITNALNKRFAASNVRFFEIAQRLGSVQTSENAIAGDGHYLSLFKWIDFRINAINGSLSQYYSADLGINAVTQNITFLQNQYNEYSKLFTVSLFSKDSDVTNKAYLDSVDGFSVGKSAFVIADGQNTINTQIIGISLVEKSLTFDKIIPIGFKKESNARVFLVK